MKSTENNLEHTASEDQQLGRAAIARLYRNSPLPEADMLFNLGLYARSGLLVKFLVMADLYQRFQHIPGLLCEFGTWYGQNLILLENLRAIYEPFNKQRRIVGFDTFEGYREGGYAGKGIYSTGKKYIGYLQRLLRAHQQANVYGHLKADHELIGGDVTKTAPAYFAAHPEVTVAFAYFDIGPYIATFETMLAIRDRLVPGSILLLDEFTLADTPGEAMAFLEVFKKVPYKITKCPLYNSKAIVEIL